MEYSDSDCSKIHHEATTAGTVQTWSQRSSWLIVVESLLLLDLQVTLNKAYSRTNGEKDIGEKKKIPRPFIRFPRSRDFFNKTTSRKRGTNM